MLFKLYQLNKWKIFAAITLAALYFSFMMNAALPFEKMIFSSMSEQISINRFKEMMANREKWQWLSYVFVPVFLVIKWLLVAVVLDIGAVIFEIELSFKKAFHIAMASEIVFLLLLLVKFGWLFYHRETLTLEYVQFFTPLSLINLIDYTQLDKWFVYPIQTINVFEVSYWFLLAYFLSKETKRSFGKSFEYVVYSYGVGLLIWMVFVSFLILNYTV
ncbi:MAG: hypothetical protein K0B10_05655 [Vicingaceae bacterium]|nr:hypothetical protein [Vicingaceae bacterium]